MGCSASVEVAEPVSKQGLFPSTNQPKSAVTNNASNDQLSLLTLKSGKLLENNAENLSDVGSPPEILRNLPEAGGFSTPILESSDNSSDDAKVSPEVTLLRRARAKRLPATSRRLTSLSVPTSPLMMRWRQKQEDELDGRSSALGIRGEGKASDDTQAKLNNALRELSRSLSASHGNIFHVDPEDSTPADTELNSSRTSSHLAMLDAMSDGNTVVINIGSGVCKGGFPQEDTPSVVMPTVVGRHRSKDALPGVSMDTVFVGHDAKLRSDVLSFSHPVQKGEVQDWEDWLHIVKHILIMELKVEPEEAKVVMPISPVASRESRENVVKLMFEKLGVQQLYLGSSAPMALHGFSITTGLVISIGHDITSCSPVVQGSVVAEGIRQMAVGGSDITARLKSLIRKVQNRGVKHHNGVSEVDIPKAMMEKLCYVAAGDSDDMMGAMNRKRTYSLPSGTPVRVDKERFLAPEILFHPNPGSVESDSDMGLHHICAESIRACRNEQNNDTVIDEICKNIVFVGGASLLPGLPERLKSELVKLMPNKEKHLTINVFPKRQYAIWRGAGRMTSLSTSRFRWITREEFEEHGAAIVHRKYV